MPGTNQTLALLQAEIAASLASNQSPPITATTLRQVMNDTLTTTMNAARFDPWKPPSGSQAVSDRVLIMDYTFGSAAAPLLNGATPINSLANLTANFWTAFNFTFPSNSANGPYNRLDSQSDQQTYVGTTNMALNATDLRIRATLDPKVVLNTAVSTLYQPCDAQFIGAPGSFTFTIAMGLDWLAGDAVAIDPGQAQGTITSYNPGAASSNLVVNVTTASGNTSTKILRLVINSGMLRTKTNFRYGYMECMARFPGGTGISPQLYLNPNSQGMFGGAANSEIDNFEVLASESAGADGTTTLHSGVIGFAASFPNEYAGIPYYDRRSIAFYNGGDFRPGPQLYATGVDLSQGFHKYGMLWVPGFCTFYLDDVPYLTTTQPWKSAQGYVCDYANTALVLNVASIGASWVGIPNRVADFPADFRIQYLRYYQSADETAINTLIDQRYAANQFWGGRSFSAFGSWTTVRSTLTTLAQIADPDGGIYGAKITEDTSANIYHGIQQIVGNIDNSFNWTFSVKAKRGTGGNARDIGIYGMYGNFAPYAYAFFNLSTGALIASGAGGGAATLIGTPTSQSLGNGWWQVWITFNIPISNNGFTMLIEPTQAGVDNYTGDGVSNIIVYDAHLKSGTLP